MQMRKVLTSLIVPQKGKSLNQASAWSIKTVLFKLGTINVHHKRHKIPWQHFWLQPPSVINQISPFATPLS